MTTTAARTYATCPNVIKCGHGAEHKHLKSTGGCWPLAEAQAPSSYGHSFALLEWLLASNRELVNQVNLHPSRRICHTIEPSRYMGWVPSPLHSRERREGDVGILLLALTFRNQAASHGRQSTLLLDCADVSA